MLLLRACAYCLTSENANRQAAIQRADLNIFELRSELRAKFCRLRQSGIDEGPFEGIAGLDVMAPRAVPSK